MAIQAQYPSNILLLNNNSRNGEEGHEYSSFQPPLGLSLLDHHHPLSNNNIAGTSNSRKRTRQEPTSSNHCLMNHFSILQSQPSHLSQQQQNVVSTGLRLSFDHQQQQIHHHQQYQHQPSHSSSFLSLLSQGLISQIKQQQHELDQFLQAQGENLRRTLAEKRQIHYQQLLTAAEEMVAQKLREKETEVAKARHKNAELEARAAQLTMEAQLWQAKARAQEATAASLQAKLQQTVMCQTGEEGVSCAVEGGQAEDAESAYVDPERVVAVARPKCRGCEKRVASVVVLPCRHLCICAECEKHYRACPVCFTLKNSTIC